MVNIIMTMIIHLEITHGGENGSRLNLLIAINLKLSITFPKEAG